MALSLGLEKGGERLAVGAAARPARCGAHPCLVSGAWLHGASRGPSTLSPCRPPSSCHSNMFIVTEEGCGRGPSLHWEPLVWTVSAASSNRTKGVKSSRFEISLGCYVMPAWPLGLSAPRPLLLRSGAGAAQRLCAGCGKERTGWRSRSAGRVSGVLSTRTKHPLFSRCCWWGWGSCCPGWPRWE